MGSEEDASRQDKAAAVPETRGIVTDVVVPIVGAAAAGAAGAAVNQVLNRPKEPKKEK